MASKNQYNTALKRTLGLLCDDIKYMRIPKKQDTNKQTNQLSSKRRQINEQNYNALCGLLHIQKCLERMNASIFCGFFPFRLIVAT